MIIDSHVHLVGEGWVSRNFLVGMARMAAALAGKSTGEYPDAEQIVDNLMPALVDTTGEKLLALMDSSGIDRACVFAVDFELATGKVDVSIEEQNSAIARAAQNHPDRLIPFFTVDPRRENAVDLLEKAVSKWGMKGLKLHPAAGFFPNESFCYPLYERCAEWGIPVIFHTGSQPAPLKFRFAHPIYIDDVAADFPDMKIVMAHVAHDLWREALLVASVKTNVYFDISGWQIKFPVRERDFYEMLRAVLDEIGPWRVFFGTDGPYLNVICPPSEWIKKIKNPSPAIEREFRFSNEEIEILMGRAFERFIST